MSKGKLAKFADMERFENVFQYPYSVVDDVPFDMKGKWREMYFHNDNPIVLELGCGKGEYTVELAKLYPEMNFIGVDIKGARMWTGAKKAIEEGQKNVSDVCEAMRVVKSHAAEWKINPDDIGIMGFSAGGHLASTFATHYPAELRPAFQILVYPVISMDKTITHSGSRENLIGKNPSQALIDYYSNEKHVNAESPRAFIALSDDDRAVPVENSLRYYKALHRYQIPVSLHIYPTGGHGWGYNESFRFKKAVHDELSDWLRSF